MTIREITTKEEWNGFIDQIKPNTFLQSWAWGQVQKKTGEEVWYLGIYNEAKQIGAALVIGVQARRGNFLLIPHGPIVASPEYTTEALQTLINHLKKNHAATYVALRVAPLIVTSPESVASMKNLGFRPAPLHIHAELTWLLDITSTEDQLISGMRKTSRHAIRRGETAGVKVEIGKDTAFLERFWPLYTATTSRQGFVAFSHDFIRSQVEEFSKTNQVYIAIAKYEGKDVASAIIICSGTTAFYYHGASEKMPANISAAHVLQWESIKYAKSLGLTHYNFWGIAPEGNSNHPFAGITTFKKGFGGYAIDYMHAQDLPLSMAYWKLWLVEQFRKLKRGF